MRYATYSVIVETPFDNKTLGESANEFLENFDFSESEIVEDEIKYARYVRSYNGVKMYYDYGGDYYFYCPDV